MNFFKTLVTPTKPSKKVTAAPGSSKEQTAQVSEAPAAPKAMSIPPPPPPEPPKMEIKGEPAAKLVKPSPKEEKKAAAKKPEASKGKSAKDTLGKFFRSKEKPVEVQQPVIDIKVEPQETAEEAAEAVVEEQTVDGEPQPPEKVDPSKAGTLEAAAKPEPPPPVQEEKKTATKSSFFSVFKQKAAEPKKVGAAPPAAPEAAQTAKTKEEPKAVAKSSDAVVDNKQASAASEAAEDLAKIPKKLEKRNSIQLFFKALGQKRHSTDAGVQTEQTTVAQAAEKTK
ncbi:breast carcinoma-amplified sequence 1 isoform X2 [Cynoglossus semilaevis]|uniref:breast carcinoma-amplified sequence 1 isoform X2 n=1 Tax=Cynoglossus semilaevis TaxID=244447 RepID=UPI000D6291C6|nr:uncharacterized protein LOC103385246 isoform X2 [Cynoglossus semilaevis]